MSFGQLGFAAFVVYLVLLAGITGTTWGLVSAQDRAEELAQVAAFQRNQLKGLDVDLMGARLRADVLERRRTALEVLGVDQAGVEQGLEQLEQSLDGVNFVDVAKESLEANIFARSVKLTPSSDRSSSCTPCSTPAWFTPKSSSAVRRRSKRSARRRAPITSASSPASCDRWNSATCSSSSARFCADTSPHVVPVMPASSTNTTTAAAVTPTRFRRTNFPSR